MNKRVYDDSFKRMAVDLTISRGWVNEVALELSINKSLSSKWKQRQSPIKPGSVNLSEKQKLIKKLQRELKDAPLCRN